MSKSSEEGEFFVERIIDKRINEDGVTEYLLKWKDFEDQDNTWEPVENLTCPEMIEAFEQSVRDRQKGPKRKVSTAENESAKKPKDTTKKVGFDKGLNAERIIGASCETGQLMFLLKWADCNDADIVPAKEANIKCPQVVIKFYEERIAWHPHNKDDKIAETT